MATVVSVEPKEASLFPNDPTSPQLECLGQSAQPFQRLANCTQRRAPVDLLQEPIRHIADVELVSERTQLAVEGPCLLLKSCHRLHCRSFTLTPDASPVHRLVSRECRAQVFHCGSWRSCGPGKAFNRHLLRGGPGTAMMPGTHAVRSVVPEKGRKKGRKERVKGRNEQGPKPTNESRATGQACKIMQAGKQTETTIAQIAVMPQAPGKSGLPTGRGPRHTQTVAIVT